MANLLSKVRSSVLRRKKRRRSAASEEGQVVKKRRKGSASVTEDSLEEGRIAAFVEWCGEVGITLHPKVCWTECVQLQGCVNATCVPCHLMSPLSKPHPSLCPPVYSFTLVGMVPVLQWVWWHWGTLQKASVWHSSLEPPS